VLANLIERASALAASPGRTLLGIAGAPGAGKSTLAVAVAAAVPGALVVPMDGFHHTTAQLESLGRLAERGTPRTFDADGYVAMVRALRAGEVVKAPSFDRSIEEPLPGTIDVPADVALVVTEGNYLLLDEPPWSAVSDLLDEVWFVEMPEELRLARLIARHVEFGRMPDEARRRVLRGSDARNAALVAATRSRADLVIDLAGWAGA
jgi:pantothenate kinase